MTFPFTTKFTSNAEVSKLFFIYKSYAEFKSQCWKKIISVWGGESQATKMFWPTF